MTSYKAYMRIKAAKQGTITGSVTQKGREGSIAVIACHHEIVSPRDPQSGLPTGKRQHQPFTVTKPTDKSTIQLYSALTTNETLTEVVIDFLRQQIKAGKGAANAPWVAYYTVHLTNASISAINFAMPNLEDPAQKTFKIHEQVSFAYQKITWTWSDGGKTTSDDWATHL